MQPLNTGAQVTGLEDDAQLRGLIAQTQAPGTGGAAPTPDPNAPHPITVNIGGQNYQFKDEAELSAQLNQYLGSLPQQPQTPAPPAAPQSGFVTGRESDEPQWNEDHMKEYVRLMGTNPIQAANYLDRMRYGIEDPVGTFRGLRESNDKLTRTIAAYQFKDAHPEFPGGQAAQVLVQRSQQLGVPFTFEGLEAAYWSLVGQGVFPNPAAVAAQQAARGEQVPQNQGYAGQPPYAQGYAGMPPHQQGYAGMPPQGVQAPPSVPRGVAEPSPDIAAQFENMTASQIADVLTKYQQAQAKS